MNTPSHPETLIGRRVLNSQTRELGHIVSIGVPILIQPEDWMQRAYLADWMTIHPACSNPHPARRLDATAIDPNPLIARSSKPMRAILIQTQNIVHEPYFQHASNLEYVEQIVLLFRLEN